MTLYKLSSKTRYYMLQLNAVQPLNSMSKENAVGLRSRMYSLSGCPFKLGDLIVTSSLGQADFFLFHTGNSSILAVLSENHIQWRIKQATQTKWNCHHRDKPLR